MDDAPPSAVDSVADQQPTVFASTADGRILEIPVEELSKYSVSEARIKELGHHPMIPYPDLLKHSQASLARDDAEDVVGGRDMIPAEDVSAGGLAGWIWHRDWRHGVFQYEGTFCVGLHCHPYGDDRAVPSDPGSFT